MKVVKQLLLVIMILFSVAGIFFSIYLLVNYNQIHLSLNSVFFTWNEYAALLSGTGTIVVACLTLLTLTVLCIQQANLVDITRIEKVQKHKELFLKELYLYEDDLKQRFVIQHKMLFYEKIFPNNSIHFFSVRSVKTDFFTKLEDEFNDLQLLLDKIDKTENYSLNCKRDATRDFLKKLHKLLFDMVGCAPISKKDGDVKFLTKNIGLNIYDPVDDVAKLCSWLNAILSFVGKPKISLIIPDDLSLFRILISDVICHEEGFDLQVNNAYLYNLFELLKLLYPYSNSFAASSYALVNTVITNHKTFWRLEAKADFNVWLDHLVAGLIYQAEVDQYPERQEFLKQFRKASKHLKLSNEPLWIPFCD